MTTASSRRRASEEAGVRSCVITSSGKWRADVCALFPSRRRHTRYIGDWSSDVCSSDPSRRRHTRYIGDWSSDVCSSDPSRRRHTSCTTAARSASPDNGAGEIGRAACRERGEISGGAVSLKKKKKKNKSVRRAWRGAGYCVRTQPSSHTVG